MPEGKSRGRRRVLRSSLPRGGGPSSGALYRGGRWPPPSPPSLTALEGGVSPCLRAWRFALCGAGSRGVRGAKGAPARAGCSQPAASAAVAAGGARRLVGEEKGPGRKREVLEECRKRAQKKGGGTQTLKVPCGIFLAPAEGSLYRKCPLPLSLPQHRISAFLSGGSWSLLPLSDTCLMSRHPWPPCGPLPAARRSLSPWLPLHAPACPAQPSLPVQRRGVPRARRVALPPPRFPPSPGTQRAAAACLGRGQCRLPSRLRTRRPPAQAVGSVPPAVCARWRCPAGEGLSVITWRFPGKTPKASWGWAVTRAGSAGNGGSLSCTGPWGLRWGSCPAVPGPGSLFLLVVMSSANRQTDSDKTRWLLRRVWRGHRAGAWPWGHQARGCCSLRLLSKRGRTVFPRARRAVTASVS